MGKNEIHEKVEFCDEQLEQIILKKFFVDSNYFTLINDFCESRFFENKNIRRIIGVLKGYYKNYNQMPTNDILKLVFDKQEKAEPGSGQMLKAEFENALNLKIENDEQFVKDGVLKFIRHKCAYNSFMDNIDGVTIKGDVSDCLNDFQKILTIGFNDDIGLDYFTDLDAHLDEICNPEAKISSGYKQFDRVTFGGIPATGKSLIVFMAQSGLGKSLFMSNLAVNFMQQGLFPLIISLEMPEMIYGKRIDAHISNLNINELHQNVDRTKDKIEGFHKLHPDSKLLIKEYPPSTISCSTIQAYVDKIITFGRKPDVLIVDYINLLMPNGRSNGNQGMYERIGDVTRELRALSYRYGIPIISATQSNREGWDTSDVSMANVSESAGIVHTCDFMGVLWQQEGDIEACRLNMKILKNRFGGMIGKNDEYYVNYNTLRISDMVREQTDEKASVAEDVINDLENL